MTMNTCPHCGGHTFSAFEKWRSTQAHPAQCEACGAMSFVPHAISGGIFIGSLLLLVVAGFAASAFQNGFILMMGAIAAMANYLWRWSKVHLTITGGTNVREARKRDGWLLGLWVLVSALFN
jgi:hypothetical protein